MNDNTIKDVDGVAIKVENISKSFKLPHEKQSSVKGLFVNLFNGRRTYEKQHVLKNISFEVKKGEFFGIVGRNGSGKSTLLKIISQIYTPENGKITVNGKLVPFIELGVGFNPELSGRDNVYLNGALLGFTRDEMESMYDEIVAFAELEKFMDQKLKNYSSGMQVRLAFSIAIRAETDILVLDEVLAVGDEAFQRKCEDYFSQVKKQGKTIILVTHSMDNVRKYCTRAMLIQGGEAVMVANPEKVADAYLIENLEHENVKSESTEKDENKPWIKAKILGTPVLKNTEVLNVQINYKNIDPRRVYVKVVVQHTGSNIMITNAKIHNNIVTKDTNEHLLKFSLKLNNFNWGDCRILALLVDEKQGINIANFGYNSELIFKIPQATKFAGIMKTTGNLELMK